MENLGGLCDQRQVGLLQPQLQLAKNLSSEWACKDVACILGIHIGGPGLHLARNLAEQVGRVGWEREMVGEQESEQANIPPSFLSASVEKGDYFSFFNFAFLLVTDFVWKKPSAVCSF